MALKSAVLATGVKKYFEYETLWLITLRN